MHFSISPKQGDCIKSRISIYSPSFCNAGKVFGVLFGEIDEDLFLSFFLGETESDLCFIAFTGDPYNPSSLISKFCSIAFYLRFTVHFYSAFAGDHLVVILNQLGY